MLSQRVLTLHGIAHHLHFRRALYSTSHVNTRTAHRPRAPIELDPDLQTLLQDTDISLRRARGRSVDPSHRRTHRELQVIDSDGHHDVVFAPTLTVDEEEEARLFPSSERKSPAASFGSRRIGAVVLPFELEHSILRLISESDKGMVHADATRLFQEENAAEDAWSTRYTPPKYTIPTSGSRMSHIKARLARNRDGTAFGSVVMPAQYAVVSAVLAGVITRLGPEWSRGIDRIIEWGSGTGAGLWASLHAFGRTDADGTLAASRISSYTGIDKRDGLTTIARRLLRDVPLGSTSVSFQKSLHSSDRIQRIEGLSTIALSTFTLSTLGNSSLRLQMIREMWDSGADVIVVIDDSSTYGFQYIAEARASLLKFGQRELSAIEATGDDITNDSCGKRGAHVIAPCPHDFACPLQVAGGSGVRCTFEQRMQRPAFVRRTKHSGGGEEDVGYSYLVVRRGERPRARMVVSGVEEGRVGAVGRWAEEAARSRELGCEEQAVQDARWMNVVKDVEAVEAVEAADGVNKATDVDADADAEVVTLEARANVEAVEAVASEDIQVAVAEAATEAEDAVADSLLADQALEDALRLEAYTWPRINFPPLKRSGHILVDACMPNGEEMRLTYPRSQGKQIYYDARKSAWGDLFPHVPKHKPVPRYAVSGVESKRESGGVGLGGEGALAEVGLKGAGRAKWGGVMEGLKEENRRRRKERKSVRGRKEIHGEEDY